jgi:RNA polymerase sigma-70 factor (ECF subfamily)
MDASVDRPPSESELLHRLRAGDTEAFGMLIDRHHGALLRLAQAFVPSRAVAEEVVQETWLAVLEGLGSFEGRSSLSTWIYRILTNRAKTRGSRERRNVPMGGVAGGGDDSEPAVDPARFDERGMWGAPPRRWEADAADRLAMNREALGRLEAALSELPAGQRAVVTLRDIEGLSSEEVCNVLEISETNQRVLLHRGRSKLRAALEDYVDRT